MLHNVQTMTEIAALELRKAIMRGQLIAGMRLIPAKLEPQLGLSRISIREAIRELVGTGLVESATHKGAYIAEPLDIDEIREIFELRYQVEGKAAFLGAQHISEADIIRMEMILEKSKMMAEDAAEGFFLNQEFHMILYQASGWKYLTKVIGRLFDQVLVFRSSLYRRYGKFNQDKLTVPGETSYLNSVLLAHRRIVQFLREKRPEDVRNITISHLKEHGFDNIYQIYKQIIIKESQEL